MNSMVDVYIALRLTIFDVLDIVAIAIILRRSHVETELKCVSSQV